ncbi:MAG: carbamoyltransferase family protein [Solirubrobacteraceae bacterium]
MRILGVNGVFHDPAAALLLDGATVAAAEEERFSRRKHGKAPVPFSTWELPEQAAAWCLRAAGCAATELDAVAYSYDPTLAPSHDGEIYAHEWEPLRTLYAQRAPLFLGAALPGLDPRRVRFVPHHVAHAFSACAAAPCDSCAVLVVDGRGESTSHLAGRWRDGRLEVLATQRLPHSLGLMYEELTEHLGFRRSPDEYKVMALASYGQPRHSEQLRQLVYADGEGGFRTHPIDWERFAPRVPAGAERCGCEQWGSHHANLAASVQRRLEEVLLELCGWLHERTGERWLTMAGGVALNCVANSRIWRDSKFEQVWVQPAAGDSGTALGAAMCVANELGEQPAPMSTAALGREWGEGELAAWLAAAGVAYERPDDLAQTVAEALAGNQIVAWFQGRSEYGPRALGHRSLLADPRAARNLERLNDVKGREQFRPVAPIVIAERAAEIFDGPLPSPYMLFTHTVHPEWRRRIPAVVHVDASARTQTVDRSAEPLLARLLDCFEQRTGVPVLVNTSLNTAGRPMADDPRDALECLGSAPIDLLAIGPFVVRRAQRLPAPHGTAVERRPVEALV